MTAAGAQAATQLQAAAARAKAGAAALPLGPASDGQEATLDVGEARRIAGELQELLQLKAAGNRCRK